RAPCDRYRRDRRHAVRHLPRAAADPGVLRGGAQAAGRQARRGAGTQAGDRARVACIAGCMGKAAETRPFFWFFSPPKDVGIARQAVRARASETASPRPAHAPRLGQTSMSDSPPQAIHGLLSAYPGRDAALTIHWYDFGRSGEADVNPHGPYRRRLGLRPRRLFAAGGRNPSAPKKKPSGT